MSRYRLKWSKRIAARNRLAGFSWTGIDYPAAVYYGVTLRDGTRLPGRRWIEDQQYGALSRVDLEDDYARTYRSSEDFERAFRKTAEGLADASLTALADKRWPWPGQTLRSDGGTVGTPRNIVDSRRLYRSQRGPNIR